MHKYINIFTLFRHCMTLYKEYFKVFSCINKSGFQKLLENLHTYDEIVYMVFSIFLFETNIINYRCVMKKKLTTDYITMIMRCLCTL